MAYHKFVSPEAMDSELELTASVVFQPKDKAAQLDGTDPGASTAALQGLSVLAKNSPGDTRVKETKAGPKDQL